MAAPYETPVLSATQTSDPVPGSNIQIGQGRSLEDTHAYQVVRGSAATGTVDVALEAGLQRANGSIVWDTVGTVSATEIGQLTPFTLIPGATYRFNCKTGSDPVIGLLG